MKAQKGEHGFFVTEVRIFVFRYEAAPSGEDRLASIQGTREEIPASTLIVKLSLKPGDTERDNIVRALSNAAEKFKTKYLDAKQDKPLSDEVVDLD